MNYRDSVSATGTQVFVVKNLGLARAPTWTLWIDSIIADSDVNKMSKVSAGTDGVRYYLSLPGVTIDREIVFDPRYRAFLLREGQSYHRYLHWRMP